MYELETGKLEVTLDAAAAMTSLAFLADSNRLVAGGGEKVVKVWDVAAKKVIKELPGHALAVLALGHIDPNFSYWTTSGEFVFAAILAGHHSVVAVFVASFVLEMVRSFSNLYFPNSWQLALGLFLLVIIRFLPQGIGWIWRARRVGGR